MTYANSGDSVNQLYEATKNIYEELKEEAEKDDFSPEAALKKLKGFSQKVGEVTGNFLSNLCDFQKLPLQESSSLEKLQEVQKWVEETIQKLVNFQPTNTTEQGVIPRFPRGKK